MSNVVQAAATVLVAALKTVEGLRFHGLGQQVDPPGLVLGPPLLQWEGVCTDPTSATFSVFLIVGMDDRAMERLWQYVTPVAEAVESVTNAVVRDASPGVYNANNQDLPCYTLSVEVSL